MIQYLLIAKIIFFFHKPNFFAASPSKLLLIYHFSKSYFQCITPQMGVSARAKHSLAAPPIPETDMAEPKAPHLHQPHQTVKVAKPGCDFWILKTVWLSFEGELSTLM